MTDEQTRQPFEYLEGQGLIVIQYDATEFPPHADERVGEIVQGALDRQLRPSETLDAVSESLSHGLRSAVRKRGALSYDVVIKTSSSLVVQEVCAAVGRGALHPTRLRVEFHNSNNAGE